MKRFWTALAVVLLAVAALAGCNDYNNSVQYNTGATLTNLSPSGVTAGSAPANAAQCQDSSNGPKYACFTLYVIASSLNPFSGTGTLPVVQWNGKKLPTTFIDTTNISAEVPYSLVADPGSVAVNVYQPQNQGSGYNGLSNALTFIVYGAPNPVPTLTAISPTSTAYCASGSKCADVPITVTGSNFLPVSQNGGSSVTFTGLASYGQEKAITVTAISSTQMTAVVPGSLLCAPDTAQINVLNPPSAICLLNCPNLGGGDTNTFPNGTTQIFTITAPPSTANSCPANVPAGTNVAEAAAISQDGRYVAVASPQNGISQVVLRDTCLNAPNSCAITAKLVSSAPDGSVGNADSRNAAMTPDGRYVAFSSNASNLLEHRSSGRQVFLRDTCLGQGPSCMPNISQISVDEQGKLSGRAGVLPAVSASGRFVAFLAESPKLVGVAIPDAGASPNVSRDVFVRDTCAGVPNCSPVTTSISSGSQNLIAEEAPTITRDGRYVTYTALVGNSWQIILADTCAGVMKGCVPSRRTISIASDGSPANGDSHNASASPDARYVAYGSAATNLVDSAPLGRQIYLTDTCIGASPECKMSTTLVSTDNQGRLSGTEAVLPSLSASGRYVAFLAVMPSHSSGSWVAPNSGLRQVFVRDTCLGVSNCAPSSTRISIQPGDSSTDSVQPVGPTLAALGKQVALPEGKTATVFTTAIPVTDRVVLAGASLPK